MKKFFIFAISLALGTSVYADGLRIFKCSEDGIPGQTEPQLMGFNMSSDGHYVCGTIEQGAGLFIADNFTGEVKWMVDGEASSELRCVDNNGVAIGFIDEYGVLFTFDTGAVSDIDVPSGYLYVQGEGLSNGGSVMVGELVEQAFIKTLAAYSIEGGEWKMLSNPSDAELGNLKQYISDMSGAKFVSDDGKVILGHLGSFSYPIVWTRDEDGEYVPDFFPERYVKAVEEDRNDETRPLYAISGSYTCLSHNGKYVGSIGLVANDDNTYTRIVPVIYDTEEKSLKIYDEMQDIDEMGLGLFPRAIANDGTFVGTVAQPSTPQGNYGAFIMKAGQTQAESYLEAFPEFAKILGESDALGQNIPTAISADGKYILGYTYYSDDYDLSSDAPAYYATYVISLVDSGVDQLASSVEGITPSIYSVDGRKLGSMAKGLNIVRNSDGSVKKILKK